MENMDIAPLVLTGGAILSEDIGSYPSGIIIPVDKPYRWTSADVIRKIKFAAVRHFGKKNLNVDELRRVMEQFIGKGSVTIRVKSKILKGELIK